MLAMAITHNLPMPRYLTAILLLMLTCLAGCNVVGAVQYAAMGPPRQEAMYVPPKRPTLVLVENYKTPSAVAMDADRLAMLVGQELAAQQVAPIVDQAHLSALRERKGSEFRNMRISEIGRAVQADQVIYINLVESEVQQTAGLLKAVIAVRVKVVDAHTGETLWPKDSADGYLISNETPVVRPEENVTESTIRAQMLALTARHVGRLFYSWKPSGFGDE